MFPSHRIAFSLSSYSLLDTRPLGSSARGLVDDCTFGLVDRPAGMIKEGIVYIALYAGEEAIEVIYYRTRYVIIIDVLGMTSRPTARVVNRRSRAENLNRVDMESIGDSRWEWILRLHVGGLFGGGQVAESGRVHQGWLRTHTDFLYPGVPPPTTEYWPAHQILDEISPFTPAASWAFCAADIPLLRQTLRLE